jgi:RND family efflux transporter MFP subunit
MLCAGVAVSVCSDAVRAADDPKANPVSPIRVEKCFVKSLKEVVIGFDRPGILGKLDIQEGDLVNSGQVLANLKDDAARAALNVAQLQADSDFEIIYAQLAADVAKVEHEKMLEANRIKAKTIPDLEVLRARLNHDKALAEVDKAKQSQEVFKAKRDEAKVQLDTYRLEAPFDGFVTRLHLVTGASVKQGDPVIELVSTQKVKVEGFVSVRDSALIKPGCPVDVYLDRPAEVGEVADARKPDGEGKIVFVDVAKVTAVGSKVRVWAEVENPDKLLRAGLTATMTIHPAPKSN